MLAFGLGGPCHARNKGKVRERVGSVSLVACGKPSLSDVQELEPCSPSGLSCYARNHSDSFNCTTQVLYLLEY